MESLIGKKIPGLKLECYDSGKIRKLSFSELEGKWIVLLFYPADFTFVCPTELEEAAENYHEFKNLGAEVLSVSTDTAYSHRAWHENSPAVKKVRFPMISDLGGKLCKYLGTYSDKENLSFRATFIIDPEGKIKAYEMHNNEIGRNIKEILRKLQAMIFVEKNQGFVCPASWSPGKNAIKPE